MTSVTDRELKEQKLVKLRNELQCVQNLYERIRFSGMYFSYKWKSFWSFFDFIALYNHMFVYFVVLILQIYWWFNLVNILQLSTLIIFNFKIGYEIMQLRIRQRKKHEKD